MSARPSRSCEDCSLPVDRRSFFQTLGGSAVAGLAANALWNPAAIWAAPTQQSAAESAVGRLYGTLTESQKKTVLFPFDHELKHRINANWHITKPLIRDDFYTKEQRALITEIVKNVTTPEGFERLEKQTEFDDGGIGGYSIAVFGSPDSKCLFELTGRHLTLRADGNSVDKAAFGGPIVYGHGEEDPKENLFSYQTKQVNEVFRALDPKQAKVALLPKAPTESAVDLQGPGKTYPGLAVSELSADQKGLVEKTLKMLLGPYRAEDTDEVMAILKASGGLDQLHLAFYQQGDLGNDKEWDIWRVEGPSFVWHFRGAPHVHAYVNIGQIG